MRYVFTIATLAFCLTALFAQDYRGKVQGIVTDSSQAVVVGAKVTLVNVNTGISVTKDTNNLGNYRFDFVDPGTYRIEAVVAGFSKSIQQGVRVETGGDVTVNFALSPGRVSQSLTVTADPVELQFNSTTKDLTVTSTQLTQLPFQDRGPMAAAFLDPAVLNVSQDPPQPYLMWVSTEIDFGGQTARQNDVLIDGSSTVIGPKGSYSPTMEGVQEMVVVQDAVDAEYGHSAGGVISMSTPQGTNKLHGTAFYYGVNPALNAVTDVIDRAPSVSRSNIWGGTTGGPIKKNKLFDFFDYEGRLLSTPNTTTMTLPTAAERTGDYSQSLNKYGNLRTIYNPFTTVFDPVSGVATRTPFPGNIIPQNMLDPSALKMMSYIWLPNATPTNSAGANNFRSTVGLLTHYYNFSDRVDWNKNEKLKIFGRYSQFHTLLALPDYTGINSPAEDNWMGGVMLSKNFSADAVYTLNPSTVLDLRFGYSSFNDDSAVGTMSASAFAGLWPGDTWYQPYMDQWGGKYLFPYLPSLGFGEQILWFQHPHSYTGGGKIVRAQGRHNLKAGLETRREAAFVTDPANPEFDFSKSTTASTFINPDTSVSGDKYATFLLGAPDDTSYASYATPTRDSVFYYGAYVQDDFKVSRRITLNLGLRYEYESAPVDVQNRFTRYLDLSTANPTLQANPPQYTAQVTALRSQYLGAGAAAPAPNGNWVFADSSHRSQFSAPGFSLAPRAGIAIRLDNKTVFHAGDGRFLVLNSQVQDGLLANNQTTDYAGFSAYSTILPSQEGMPQTALAHPFPSSNPLQPVQGKTLGVNTNLGNGFGDSWGDGFRDQSYQDGRLDRYNFTIQRELPGKLRFDASFVLTNGHNLDSFAWWDSFNENEANPMLNYNATTGPAMLVQYPNPFYNYLTPTQYPGGLRNQPTVKLSQLLRPYPQYGDLYLGHVPIESDLVRNLEFRVQRSYSNGMNLLASYIYNREQSTWWPDEPYRYDRAPMWMEGNYPRHRVILSGIYDLPVGHARKWLNHTNRWLDGVVGGWSCSSIFSITSGDLLNLTNGSGFVLTGDPTKNVPAGYAFNTAVFANLPAYTMFTGPRRIAGVDGPGQWNIDGRLSKSFRIREGMDLQFRMEAYNLTNSPMWKDPDSGFGDSNFGQLYPGQNNVDRTLQYALRLTF